MPKEEATVSSVEGDHTPAQMTTIQTSDDNHQLIMLTFNESGGLQQQSNVHFYNDTMTHEHRYAEDVSRTKEQTTQTETIFGLKDLPTVTEIVNNKIQEKKKQEEPDLSGAGPVNGIYTCAVCARVYRNKVSWQNHLQSHNGEEVYMCGICGSLFNRKITLKAHLDIHIRDERKARMKQQKYLVSSDMKIGGVYMPGDIVESEIAKEVEKEVAPQPVLEYPDNQPIIQEAAQEEVPSTNSHDVQDTLEAVEGLENEVETEDGSSFIYACNICGQQYNVKADCEKHLKVHTPFVEPEKPEPERPKPKAPSPEESPEKRLYNKAKFSAYIYACNVCGKQYTNKSNCKRHMRIHTDEEKNFECETCHKRFAQKYEVKMHARIHTGEKPYSCAVCGKNFTERGNWRRHTQIHVKPQEASPYRCGICCKGFFHADKLQIHLQIHSGQRPFVCTVCGRKAKKIGDMYRHLRTHTGEKPYKCQVCGKGFAQNGNLKDHMKMHTGEKPHECDLCGKTFSRKILLKEHVKNHHKGSTLKDLTEAALEEIERQEAKLEAMETGEELDESVVHELGVGEMKEGKIFIVRDEADLLQEEQDIELQEVQSTLTEKELEAAHVLTVVQDAESLLYTVNMNNTDKKPLTEMKETPKMEPVQNS